MIRAGLLCPDLHTAARLIGLLLRHPDVDLCRVVCPALAGTPLVDVLPQYIGETSLTVAAAADFSAADVVLAMPGAVVPPATSLPEGLRVVAIDAPADDNYLYGLCECNRRRIVAPESRLVACPDAVAHAATLTLLPLAKNRSLPERVAVEVIAGKPREETASKLAAVLAGIQPDWQGDIALREAAAPPADHPAAVVVATTLHCNTDLEQLRQCYDDYYDDHHFTYLFGRVPTGADVAGSNKCLLHLRRTADGQLAVTAALDARLKGSVGNAVHCMNLLFGLDERVGLMKS